MRGGVVPQYASMYILLVTYFGEFPLKKLSSPISKEKERDGPPHTWVPPGNHMVSSP